MSTPRSAPSADVNDRRLGALLGAAVGDAYGTTLEFTAPPAARWTPPLTGPHVEILGGGPFGVVAGQITDDTQMACCLGATLAEHGHAPPSAAALDALAGRYRAWVACAFDAGNQTRNALNALERHPPSRAGFIAWEASGGRAAGNGALMRAAPLGALPDPATRRAWALADAGITHADPRCLLANVAYTDALAAGIAGADAQGMVDAARAGLDVARADAPSMSPLPADDARWGAAHADLHLDLDAADRADPWLNGEAGPPAGWPPGPGGGLHLAGSMQGFVRVAFRVAFWQLRHADDWRVALVDTVNRGGDADTNGAIAGALLGSRWGASAIPSTWRARVLDANPRAPWGPTGSWHPRVLVAGATLSG